MAQQFVDRLHHGPLPEATNLSDGYDEELEAQELADARRAFHHRMQKLHTKPFQRWTNKDLDDLERLVRRAISDARSRARKESKDASEAALDEAENEYLRRQLEDNVRSELRAASAILLRLPDPDRFPAYKRLHEAIGLHDKRTFDTALPPTSPLTKITPTRLSGPLLDLVAQADRLATAERRKHLEENDPGRKGFSWEKTTREIRKKRTRRVAIGLEEAEDLAEKAVATVLELRSLLSPPWTPQEDPGWLAMSRGKGTIKVRREDGEEPVMEIDFDSPDFDLDDSESVERKFRNFHDTMKYVVHEVDEVYHLALSDVDKTLFEESQAYQQTQFLRSRAQQYLMQSVARKKTQQPAKRS